MIVSLIQYIADVGNSDFKEIQMLFVLILMTFLSGLFKYIPLNQDKQNPFLYRRIYGGCVGLLVHYILLTFCEFCVLNCFLLFFFFFAMKQRATPQQKFMTNMISFCGIFCVGAYLMIMRYGEYYPSHIHVIVMILLPKTMYFLWQADGKA
jgi:hypothetical protein